MTINKNISIIGTTSQGDKVFVEETGKKNEVFDKGEKIGVKDKASGKVKYDQATVDNANFTNAFDIKQKEIWML